MRLIMHPLNHSHKNRMQKNAVTGRDTHNRKLEDINATQRRIWITFKGIFLRVRTKDCYVCKNAKEVLYRCRYENLKDWVFLCGKCLTDVKLSYEETYQYGGTWKSKKRLKGRGVKV